MKEKKKFKIKKVFKNSIFTFVLGIFLTSVIGVSAATLLYSSDVTYDNSSSGLSSTNLQDALDELYEQASSGGGSSIKFGGITANILTESSGLFIDTAEEGRYIYRGSSPNNYITFNDETWRIISVESDGTIKIIRNEQLSNTYAWDAAGTRNSSTSTYCTNASDYGCNAWAATANLVGSPNTFIQYYEYGNPSNYSETYSGTVTGDASLNTYLNGDYYNSLTSTYKAKVVNGTFNVSTPGFWSDTETLEVDAQQEKQYQWQGYVALITVTELLKASTNLACTSLSAGYGSSHKGTCNASNWLWPTFNTSSFEWTLSPLVNSNRRNVWYVYSGGFVSENTTSGSGGVRPVVYLSSDITFSGSGTESDPYTIN